MATSTPHYPPAQKRPKLSLQTSSLPVNFTCTSNSFPTAISSLAATPTTLNTFNNTYDLTHRSSPTSYAASSVPSRLSRSQSPRPSRRSDHSYHVPYGVRSILKHSTAPGYTTASPSTGTRKVFFPQPKKVSFKFHLEEEIVNEVYTAKHSDLVWEDDDHDVMESIERQPDEQSCRYTPPSEQTPPSTVRGRRNQHDSSVTVSFTEIKKVDAEPAAATAPHSRKRRRWEWTLSPVPVSCQDDATDTSDLDSEWVVVSIQRNRSEISNDDVIRPTKRRAASVDAADDDEVTAKRRVMRAPVRANTL